jgi:hypothetical protein
MRAFVVAVFCQTFDFCTFDRHRALVFINAAAVEDAHFNDRTRDTRRHAQRGVFHVGRLFHRRSRAEVFLPASSGFRLSASLYRRECRPASLRRRYERCRLHRGAQASSPTFGISRVISSGPSLVSRAITSNSSMWIEVNTSSLARYARRSGSSLRSCSRSTA